MNKKEDKESLNLSALWEILKFFVSYYIETKIMRSITWHSIKIHCNSINPPQEKLDEIAAVNNIALTLQKKRSCSSIWFKFSYDLDYEILIPNLTDNEVEILRSLGYELKKSYVDRLTRRESYKKLKRNGQKELHK